MNIEINTAVVEAKRSEAAIRFIEYAFETAQEKLDKVVERGSFSYSDFEIITESKALLGIQYQLTRRIEAGAAANLLEAARVWSNEYLADFASSFPTFNSSSRMSNAVDETTARTKFDFAQTWQAK
nr:MAG TPA: hypothetical protein [Caudoviricetes sp.]